MASASAAASGGCEERVGLGNSQLLTLRRELVQIDWSTWESTIQRPGLVAAFKAAHQSVPVLKCESPYTAELESGFAKLVRLGICILERQQSQLSCLSSACRCL